MSPSCKRTLLLGMPWPENLKENFRSEKDTIFYGILKLRINDAIKEIDARPSDCIAMAAAQHAPIYVSLDVWDEVEDMTEALRKMQEEGSHGEESDEEEDS